LATDPEEQKYNSQDFISTSASGKAVTQWEMLIREYLQGNKLLLQNQNLTFVDESLCSFERITDIDLSQNSLSSLPLSISKLSNLKSLKLSHNKFKELPVGIKNLENLKTLEVDSNLIIEIFYKIHPSEIYLDSLEYLNLCKNKLSRIPPCLKYLSNLKHLLLGFNQIKDLFPLCRRGRFITFPILNNLRVSAFKCFGCEQQQNRSGAKNTISLFAKTRISEHIEQQYC